MAQISNGGGGGEDQREDEDLTPAEHQAAGGLGATAEDIAYLEGRDAEEQERDTNVVEAKDTSPTADERGTQDLTPEEHQAAGRLGATPSDIAYLEGRDVDTKDRDTVRATDRTTDRDRRVQLQGQKDLSERAKAAEQIEKKLSEDLTPKERKAAGKLGATPADIQQLQGVDVDLTATDVRKQDGEFVLSKSGTAAVGAARFRKQGLNIEEEDVRVSGGQVELTEAANRQVAAKQLSERLGVDVSQSEVVKTADGWRLSDNASRQYAAAKISEQIDTDIDPTDLEKTKDGWTISDRAEKQIIADRFQEDTGVAIAAADVIKTDDGWELSSNAQKQLAAEQLSDELGFVVKPTDLEQAEDGGYRLKTEGVTPHVQMVANQQSLIERARRERGIEDTFQSVVERVRGEVGEAAESPVGFAAGLLSSGGVTTGEAASIQFQLGEELERAGLEFGETVKSESLEVGQEATEFIFGDPDPLGAPTVGGQTVGEAAAGALAGAVSVPFQVGGAATQYPVTAGMDIQQTDVEIEGRSPATRRVTLTSDTPTATAGGLTGATARGAEKTAEYFAERPLEAAFLAAPVAIPAARGAGAKLARGKGPIGQAVGRVPRPGISRFAVGEGGGRSLVLRTTEGKVVSERPLVTVRRGSPGRAVEAGTPTVRLTKDPITPDLTAAETRGLVSRLQKTEPTAEVRGAIERLGREPRQAESARVEAFRETQRQTQFSELQPKELESTIGNVLESHGVPRRAAKDVIQQVKADEGAVYGSVTQKAAAERVGEPGVTRTPKDIDIADVPSKSRFAEQITRKINERAGREIVEVRDGTPVSKATGEKIFDIHEAEVPTTDASPSAVGDQVFGVKREADILTSEGIKTTTLSEQTARKGSGAMYQITREPRTVGSLRSRLTPEHAGRLKDIADFYTGERANIKALRARGQTKRATRARENLERFIESFGDELATSVRQKYRQTAKPTTKLAEFSKTAEPRTVSAMMRSARPAPGRPRSQSLSPSGSRRPRFASASIASSLIDPSRMSASVGGTVTVPSFGSMGISQAVPSIGSAISEVPSSPGVSISIPGSDEPGSSPRDSVSVPGSDSPSPISSPPASPVSTGISLAIPRYPSSTTTTVPPDRDREDEDRDRPSREPLPGVRSDPESWLNVGWLGETQLGFAGIDVQSAIEKTGQEELEQQAESMEGFTFELLPALSAEQAERLEATQELFFSR